MFSLWSDRILTPGRRRLGRRLPAAAVLSAVAAISMHDGYSQLVGPSETVAVPAGSHDRPRTAKVAANPTVEQPPVALGSAIDSMIETTGSHRAAPPSPAADFDVQPSGTEAFSATNEQRNAVADNKLAPKPHVVRRKPARNNNVAPTVAASANGPQALAPRSGGNQNGLWSSNWATGGQRVHLARPRGFDWPF
jgi:hypothetical protein